MPFMLPAAAATTAIGTGAAVGAGVGALGTGLAAGTALAGGAGLLGKLGLSAIGTGLGGAGGVLGGAALTPAVASLAPAATAQAAGTIAPSIIQSTGLEALKGKVIGAGVQNAAAQQATNLAFQKAAAQNMANAAGSQFTQAAPNFLGRDQVFEAFSRQGAGQNLTQLGPNLAGPADAASLTPQTTNLAETIRNTNTAMRGPVNISYASGAQGIAPNAVAAPTSGIQPGQNFMQNLGNFFQDPSMQAAKDYASEHPYATSAMAGLGAMGISKLMEPKKIPTPEDKSMIRPYTYERTQRPEAYATSPSQDSSERLYFNDQFNAGEPYKAAEGGIASAYAMGGPVEEMSRMNSIGANTGFPMARLQTPAYAVSSATPMPVNALTPSADASVDAYSGAARFAKGGTPNPTTNSHLFEYGQRNDRKASDASLPKYEYNPNTMQFTQTGGENRMSGGIAPSAMGAMQTQPQSQPQRPAASINVPAYQTPEQQLGLSNFYDYMNQQLSGYGGYARGGNVGGEANLGDYSDGGRLLKGPGDGVSDSIPAVIGKRQPARLADGEFVIPARIVSELGNGSTEAGARKLYAMMERVQNTRRKSIGKKKVAVNSKADKHLPA
jgi:hypothetical protein